MGGGGRGGGVVLGGVGGAQVVVWGQPCLRVSSFV